MIESKKYACPECSSYGHIIVRGDELVCGSCERVYTEEQALDLTKSDNNDPA
jgi:ribosomal protein S27AE